MVSDDERTTKDISKSSIYKAYLPIDRLHALINGVDLPDRVQGAALFADISGFTPLTAALADEFGRQRGAEMVLDYINPIYESVIDKLRQFHGSVIGFAGDSITCWLDDDDGRRGVTCALAMQEIMGQFATITTPGGKQVSLGIKIAVAAGPARRFLVGNPEIHSFEALAGKTLERMAAAEGQAERGDVVVSQEVAHNLGDLLEISEWREDGAFAVVEVLTREVTTAPWPELPDRSIPVEAMRPWIDVPVYERLHGGATYLAELRPAASLFIKFSGIDYDRDDAAGEKLNAFVRWVQSVLARYGGYMLQLTIGDKGSNILAVFGAPVTHDDDERRTVVAALDLSQRPSEFDFIQQAKIGVSQGLVWAGAVGGRLRCIYTVMGDEVNMAARLMGKASPEQVLVSGHVVEETSRFVKYNDLSRIQVKGKDEPLEVSEAIERIVSDDLSGLFTSPLVGRESELIQMSTLLNPVDQGQGVILRLEAGAGVGKSHLAAAFAAQTVERGWELAHGACGSTEQSTPYYPWRRLLRSLIEPSDGIKDKFQETLLSVNPEWEERLPILGDLLGETIPNNPVIASLEPRQRQDALFSLVSEIVQAWAAQNPLLLVLEDAHWIDEASQALTAAVGRAIRNAPVALLVIQRPPLSDDQPILPEIEHLDYHHKIELGDLNPEGTAQLAANRLGAPLTSLAQTLIFNRAQGNPFFTEELVDALCEAAYLEFQPVDENRYGPREKVNKWTLSEQAFSALLEAECLVKLDGEWQMIDDPPLGSAKLDIPDSVHGTVLARLDRLPENHKLTLKTASVIGRTFGLKLLEDIHPNQDDRGALLSQIGVMGLRDFVRVEKPGEDPVYIFKHNTTQEVAYGTLLFAQRRQLHTRVAEWYEAEYDVQTLDSLNLESPLAPYYPLLAHHWQSAENPDRERIYAGLAGEGAAKKYANESAARYYSQALELSPDEDVERRYKLLLGREAVYDVLSVRDKQADDLSELEKLAKVTQDTKRLANVYLRWANFADMTSDYQVASQATEQAVEFANLASDLVLMIKAYHQQGRILHRQGSYNQALDNLRKALSLAQEIRELFQVARCYQDIGFIYREQANYPQALKNIKMAHVVYKNIGYRLGEISCLLAIGAIHYDTGHYLDSENAYIQAQALSRAIGFKNGELYCLSSLGNTYFDLGNFVAAQNNHELALIITREIDNPDMESTSLNVLGLLAYLAQENGKALDFFQQGLEIAQSLGALWLEGYNQNYLGLSYSANDEFEKARASFKCALDIRRKLGQKTMEFDDLAGLARLALVQGLKQKALEYVEKILTGIAKYGTDGSEFPVWIYLTCYRTLLANDQTERAQQVLQDGYDLLMGRAGLILDDGLRAQFLEKVPWNHELLVEWEKAQHD